MRPAEVTERIKQHAGKLGFALCGVTTAEAPEGAARLDDWLAAGYAGQMDYLADRRDAYRDPELVLPGARSVVMLALPYLTAEPKNPQPGEGRVSRYAWGSSDYHNVIRERLKELSAELKRLVPHAKTRGVVDTAPLLERDFAQRAGLGWIGKNTLLLNKPTGSYYFLAALLTDVDLESDDPSSADHCGTCTACLDACPTDAFPQPYVLDARRCISYLTIELRDHVPEDLREGIGDWVFGCDVCQQVCPWNNKSPTSEEPAFAPVEGMNPLELTSLFDLDEAGFRERFRHTPLWRAHREGLLRNAAIVLGNHPVREALPALLKGLADDSALVRDSCAWALEQLAVASVVAELQERLANEADADVRSEIAAALGSISRGSSG